MTILQEQSTLRVMKERAAVKRYQPGREIPKATLEDIIRSAGSAPSAWNLQHWKFIVVQEQARKDRLLPAAYNQQQVAECSALVVVLADLEANRNAEPVFAEAVREGFMTEEIKATLIGQIEQAYANIPNVGMIEAYKNSSLAAMQLMLAAKAYDIDSCPMGGFNADAVRAELRIPERYVPSMLISLGYGAKPAHESGRLPLTEIMVPETF